MLIDSSVYTKLMEDPTDEGVLMGVLTQKMADYIGVKYPIIPIYHSLPKIYKEYFPPPLRPIVAGIGTGGKIGGMG